MSLDAVLVDFGRALRGAGVPATPDRIRLLTTCVSHLDPTSRADVHAAGRATCCSRPEHLPVYDRVFTDFFRAGPRSHPPPAEIILEIARAGSGADDGTGDSDEAGLTASRAEALRRRDLAELTDAERGEVAELLAHLVVPPPTRRARRHRRDVGGRADPRATFTHLLHHAGEIDALPRRRPHARHRRIVVVLDVSGSMRPYVESYLRLAHALVRAWPQVEVFTAGTRLARVTDAFGLADPDAAIGAAGRQTFDWSGGTRLGETLACLLAWGRRGPLRGAVVVVASDGWERGEVGELSCQMTRLGLLAARIVWINPHRGRPGFAPDTAGMRAVLPHLDDFVAGHRLLDLLDLVALLSRPARRADSSRVGVQRGA